MLQKQLNLYQTLGGQFQPESGGQFVPETWGSVSPGFRGSICVDFPLTQSNPLPKSSNSGLSGLLVIL